MDHAEVAGACHVPPDQEKSTISHFEVFVIPTQDVMACVGALT